MENDNTLEIDIPTNILLFYIKNIDIIPVIIVIQLMNGFDNLRIVKGYEEIVEILKFYSMYLFRQLKQNFIKSYENSTTKSIVDDVSIKLRQDLEDLEELECTFNIHCWDDLCNFIKDTDNKVYVMYIVEKTVINYNFKESLNNLLLKYNVQEDFFYDKVYYLVDKPKLVRNLDYNDVCCVCLEDYTGNKSTIVCKCMHKFHYVCIRTLDKCPLCRTVNFF